MLAIINGTVMTITHGTIEHGTVLIDGGKITAVGAGLTVPPGTQIIDAAGKVVMPGLIDAHCHTGLFGDGIGWEHADGNEMTDPITPHMRALDGIHPEDIAFPDLVEAGVTTIMTGPGSGNLIGGTWACIKTAPKPSIEEMILLEPAGMKMALGENPRRVYGSKSKMPSTRMGNAGELRSALVSAQNYRAKWQQYEKDLQAYQDKMKAGEKDTKEPTAPERNLKWEALARVLDRGMRVHIHAHRADDILTAVRIAEEFNLDLNIEHATEGYKIADILAQKGVPCTVGPILFSRSKYELRNLTPKNPGVLAKAGVKVAIQTDEMSAVRYLSINAALAVREGMPEEEALKAITINSAEVIGVQDRVGSLEAGKDADVVVFSGHPFDYKTVSEVVIVNGEISYRR
ncbi:MAG: amidohydrolase [Anaerolineaceae bacterium]|nr:amidohydrolase [Anaerolineaceae bacterium]